MNMPTRTYIDFHPDSPKLTPTSTFALPAPPSLASLTCALATYTFTGDYRIPALDEFYWSGSSACVRIKKDSTSGNQYILKKHSKASYPTQWRVSVTSKLTLCIPAPPTKEVCAANDVVLTHHVSVPIHDRPFATRGGRSIVDKIDSGYVPHTYDMRWELARLYEKKPPEKPPEEIPMDTPPVTTPDTPPDTGWLRDHYVALTGEFRRPEAYEMYYGAPSHSLCVAYHIPAWSYWILRAAGAKDPAPTQKLLGDRYLLTGEAGIPRPGGLYWDPVSRKVSRQEDDLVYSPVWLVRRRGLWPCPLPPSQPAPASGWQDAVSEPELEDLPPIPELAPTEKVAVHYDDRSDDEKRQEKEWKEYQKYVRSLSR